MWFKGAVVVADFSLRFAQLMPLLLRGLSLPDPTQLKVPYEHRAAEQRLSVHGVPSYWGNIGCGWARSSIWLYCRKYFVI